ncbi:hypothetical protein OG800_03285 [Streptomyces sp. NBC_00445]|uniref:hypothetical protein n=1 Tax=Streptomyces sp. NBC_00445 TaxID=2975745 RepID=UPI002E1C023F
MADGVEFTMPEDAYDQLTTPAVQQQARDVFNGLGGGLAGIVAARNRNEAIGRQGGDGRPRIVSVGDGRATAPGAGPPTTATRPGDVSAASAAGPPAGGLPGDVPAFTKAFYASEGQMLNQLARDVVGTARDLGIGNPRLTAAVSVGMVDGQLEYRVTVSDPAAYAVLRANESRLPSGLRMGPPPTIGPDGRLDPMRHVEVEGPATLRDAEGARGVIVGTSRQACAQWCEPMWSQPGSPGDVWHTNRR